jgi:hypothetical protein
MRATVENTVLLEMRDAVDVNGMSETMKGGVG